MKYKRIYLYALEILGDCDLYENDYIKIKLSCPTVKEVTITMFNDELKMFPCMDEVVIHTNFDNSEIVLSQILAEVVGAIESFS